MQSRLIVRGAADALATSCGCLGPCFDGPNAVIYPDGVWYEGLAPEDADALVDHLVGGAVHEAKRGAPPS